jgi:DNA-binding Xre family transcriptional regulator
MDNGIKDAVKTSLLPEKESAQEVEKVEVVEVAGVQTPKPKAKKKEEPPKKRRRGRPSKVHKITKLHTILENRGLTRKDLHDLIAKKYPDEAVSPDAVSRIVSGSRRYYSTTTLFRICGALNITPNMALNWEEEVNGEKK